MYAMSCSFCYQAPNSLGGHSGPFSLHLSHQENRGFSLRMTREIYLEIDLPGMTKKIPSSRRSRWCHLSTIPGTTPHCYANTEGNVIGSRSH